MKRDFFRRGVRFSHQFGETEKINSPVFGPGTFDPPPFFRRPGMTDLAAPGPHPPCEVQEYGEHSYRPQSSPVQKPSGSMASINGPSPDLPQIFGMPTPVGTKRRLGPPSTDK